MQVLLIGAGTVDEPLRQTEEVYHLERSASKRGNDTLFPSEPRHLPADIVSGSRYVILYLAGASQGEIILAVNTLLMQLFTLFSYVMDGFAYAGEALSGRYIGARNRKAFTDTVRHLFIWGAGLTVLFTLVYASGGNAFLALLTDDRNVITAADTYFYWALAIPAAGIAAFIWDGIFIGATATRGMLLSMQPQPSVSLRCTTDSTRF